MKFYLGLFLIAILIVCTANTCRPSGVGLRFRTTINVLEHMRPSVSPATGRAITGFKLGPFDTQRKTIKSVSFGPREYRLPAAGPEYGGGLCHDGTPLEKVHDEQLVRMISLIGDTGGDDISEDGDCHCDARVNFIELQPIEVVFESGENLRLPPGSMLYGKKLMCPNTSHAFTDEKDFRGTVIAYFGITLRVADNGFALICGCPV